MAASSEAPPRRAAVSILAVLTIAGWAPVAAADPDVLWTIVHGQCVPDQRNNDDPAPCALVDLDGGVPGGYAALKDLVGATQFLLIPTDRITGIESRRSWPPTLRTTSPTHGAPGPSSNSAQDADCSATG